MTLARRIALLASALGAVLFAALIALAPSSARAADAPSIVSPVGNKTAVAVHDESGAWFWRMTISDPTQYVGSWEKRGGTFASPEEAVAAVKKDGACREAVVQKYFAEFPTRAAFNAAVGLSAAGAWTSDALEKRIEDACSSASTWSDAATPGFRDASGNWTVEVPYSLIGEGTHSLFLVGVDFTGSYVDPACRKTWPDRSWVGYDCVPAIGNTVKFSITVPAHPSIVPTLRGPAVDAGSFFAQSIFSGLRPIDLEKLLPAVAAGAGATAVLGALVAFPSMLLSSAVEKMHERTSRRRRFAWLNATISGPWAILFLFAAAVIAGFSDPGFGISWGSLRMLITVFLVFMVMNFGSTYLAWRVTKKHNGQDYPDLTAKPFFLLIVAGTVFFARLTHIDPAMVFGSVLALELGNQISKATEAIVSLVVTVYTFAVGLAAWIIFSWLASIHLFSDGIAGTDGGPVTRMQAFLGFGQVSAGEFMSILTIEAFSTIPLALLPVAGLGGVALYKWKKWVWAVMYAIGMLAYVVVILPAPSAWTNTSSSFPAWVAIVIVYALVAIAAYGLVTWLNARDSNRSLLSDASHENTIPAVDAPETQTPPTLGAG